MLRSIILLWLSALTLIKQPVLCMLGPDLKRARDILHHTHGVDLVKEDRNFNLKAFNFFTKLNLNGYKFTEERIKNYYIKSWKSSGVEQIRMYEVHSSVHFIRLL